MVEIIVHFSAHSGLIELAAETGSTKGGIVTKGQFNELNLFQQKDKKQKDKRQKDKKQMEALSPKGNSMSISSICFNKKTLL